MKRIIYIGIFLFINLFAINAKATNFKLGDNYDEIVSKVEVSKPGQKEIVELFWYGCPHCYDFEPVINPWSKSLPEDINFVRVPAMFGGLWDIHGQLFLTLQAMGIEEKVRSDIFEQVHTNPNSLSTPEQMASFLEVRDVDQEKFIATYNSFAINGQVNKAKELMKSYQISGVPSMIVNGQYRFDISSAGSPQKALELAEYLANKS